MSFPNRITAAHGSPWVESTSKAPSIRMNATEQEPAMGDDGLRHHSQDTIQARLPRQLRQLTVRRIVWLSVVLLAIALVWWIHGRSAQHTQSGRPGAIAAMPVRAASAVQGDLNITLDALGTVTPLATVTVQTQINGQLTEVAFKEGQTVRKGDFLAQIDPRPYQAALDQAEGQLLKDQAILKVAQIDRARYETLDKQDSIAKQQVVDQQYTVRQSEGAVKIDQGLVDNARLNLNYCRIVSPIDGRVGLRLVDPGNYVQVNSSTGLAVITQTKPIAVVLVLPEDDLPPVLKRLHDGAKVPVTAYDRTRSTKLATGVLAAVDSQIDTSTGTVKLKALFENEDEALFPNQFVNANILVDVLHDATVVPGAAIQRGAPGTFVYLVKPDNSVAVQAVTLGPVDAERVAVQSGLSLGDRVVIDGADKLREGAKVEVRDSAPTESTAATKALQTPSGPHGQRSKGPQEQRSHSLNGQ
jgi:membrane fusion protein, multidrug efflux system